MKCKTKGCDRKAEDNGLCRQCNMRAYGFARRSMKKILKVSNMKGIVRGGKF